MADGNAHVAGRYEIVRPLGRGSFAQTLLARDTETGRTVALKALHLRAVQEWKTYELFEREGTTLRTLRHHGIPEVYDSFRAPWEGAETSFLVMEYVEGQSLADIIAERRHFDASEVLHLFLAMLGVLDYLHTRVPQILHRDVKPANVIVRPDGSPVLVDFGVVRNVFKSAAETGSTVAGTYGYMPYEQHMGQASPASDLYALAATFLHLVTGRAPQELMSDAGRLEVPETLSCGEALRDVLARLLAPAPADRYQSARAVRNALLAATATTVARAPAPVPQTPSNHPALALSPAPRDIHGATADLLARVGHSPWQLMASNEKPDTRWGLMDVVLVGFFSVLTLGVLPATFYSLSASRRRRLKQFLVWGTPATARVLGMEAEEVAFDIKLTRVGYEFEADGRQFRDSDQVLPSIATRWDRGTSIQILYIPEREYDSIIVSTS